MPGNGQGSEATAGPPCRNRPSLVAPVPGDLIAGVERTLWAIVSTAVGESSPPSMSEAAGVHGVPVATIGEAAAKAGRVRLAGVWAGAGGSEQAGAHAAMSSKARRCDARCEQSPSKRLSCVWIHRYQRCSSCDQ